MSHSRAHAVLAGLAISSAASAAVQVVTASVPLRTTNFADALSLAQFDPTLGTLEGVEIVANVGYVGRHFGENMSATSGSQYLSRLTYSVSLNGAGLLAPVVAASVNENAGLLGVHDGVYDFAGTSGYNVSFDDAGQGLASLTGVDDLSAFIGLGSIAYTITANASSFRQAFGGAMSQGTQSQAFGDVTITYTYTAIPAPGIAGSLLAGLAVFTRRRR